MSDIVERLRAPAYWISGSSEGHEGDNSAPLEAAAEIERLRAALEQIDHGWENPMDDKAYRALCRFMWETARQALAQEKPNDT